MFRFELKYFENNTRKMSSLGVEQSNLSKISHGACIPV